VIWSYILASPVKTLSVAETFGNVELEGNGAHALWSFDVQARCRGGQKHGDFGSSNVDSLALYSAGEWSSEQRSSARAAGVLWGPGAGGSGRGAVLRAATIRSLPHRSIIRHGRALSKAKLTR
jgi:hypothetical protein